MSLHKQPIIPSMQRAIIETAYGNAADVLALSTDQPVTAPSPTQVQIKVHAASLNPIDWQMIQGNRRLMDKRRFPFVPLFDLAGVVVAAGASVTRFKVGDVVHTDNQKNAGGASEYVNVEELLVSRKPDVLSFAEAAAVPLAGQTALLILDKSGTISGRNICVIGASGGVGSFVVQMAKALGAAHVYGVCSEKNIGFVKSLGADTVIDYTKFKLDEYFTDRSVHVVIDCVGGRDKWLEAQKVLLPGGKFVTISRDEDGEVTVKSAIALIWNFLGRKIRSFSGDRIDYVPVFLNASHQLLDRVDKLISSGKVKVPVSTTVELTLENLIALINSSKKGRMVGKAVLKTITEP